MSFRFIFCIAFILMLLAPSEYDWFKNLYQKRLPFFEKAPAITKAYFTGNKKQLKSVTKKIHRNLNILHLMTPSGLHLAALIFFITIFCRRKWVHFLFLIFLGIWIYPFAGIESLKRMVLFGLIKTNPIIKVSAFKNLILTFILFFCLGQYQESPLSFCLSLLFLSALLVSRHTIQTIVTLLFIQFFLSQWFEQSFYLLGALYGFILSLISPFVFFLLTIELIISQFNFSSFWLSFLETLDAIKGPAFNISLLSFLPVYFFFYCKKLRLISVCACATFLHTELTPPSSTAAFKAPAPIGAQKITPVSNGVKLQYENGLRCYARLKVDTWSTHCYL